jgi:uncharacterized protein
VSVTLTSKMSKQRCSNSLRAILIVLACLPGQLAVAEENETGFFSYFPAPPKLHLPKLDFIPFWTSDFKKARKAYDSGNYGRALEYFRKESEEGNPVADWYLGHMYRLGRGVPRDPSVAYSYYSRVAESYDPEETDPNRLRIAVDSQLRLTGYLQTGLPGAGIAADPATAAKNYLRIASNYGHPLAMYELGVMNIRGVGVTANPQQGLKWLIAAARKRSPEAEAYLGELYWKGEFVRRDETRALMWYSLATSTTEDLDDAATRTRTTEIRAKVSEDVRLEADARAKVWAEQYPVDNSSRN